MISLKSKTDSENLNGSKLVLLEGSSLGSRRHHHSGSGSGSADISSIKPVSAIHNPAVFDGLGDRRHHHGGYIAPDTRNINPVIDPHPIRNNTPVFSGLGSRRHHYAKNIPSVEVKPLPGYDDGDGTRNSKIFETIFDTAGNPIPVVDIKVQKKIEKTLLGNQWSGVFPSILSNDPERRKRFLKMIANAGGAAMPVRYTGGVTPHSNNPVKPLRGAGMFGKIPVEKIKSVYKNAGLLGESEAEEMSGVELLGMANVIRVAMESPNPDSDLYLLGELERMVSDLHGDIYGSEDLLGADIMPELRQSLSELYVNEAGFLRGSEMNNMDDNELLGFFKAIGKFFKGVGKGIGKVAKGVWKGVKGAGKFIGKVGKSVVKGVGNVAKGIGKVAKNVGTGLWKGIKGAGKFVGNVVKTIGKGALDVGKFALKNAGGLLKAGLSFIPGGGIAAGLLDMVLPDKSGEQQQEYVEPPPQEQYAPPVYTPQVSNDQGMYQQQYVDPTQYVDPSMYQQQQYVDPSMYEQQYVDPNQLTYEGVSPEQVITDPTQYEMVSPEYDQQLTNEYYDVANDPNQEEMTQGEATELLGNFIQDVGKFLKKGVKKVSEFAINNPELLPISQRDMLFIGNKFQQGAQFKSQKNAVNQNAGMFADLQSKQLDSENKIGSTSSSMLSTYALPIGVALVALMLIMRSK